jgi:FKBP-type peptidyl-prolyl cis-trans isomerase (trigger factor)
MYKIYFYFTISFILLIILGITITVTSYSETTGVELGDDVNLHIFGYFLNETVFQQASEFETVVSYAALIEGFVDCILGMKIGEIKLGCEVPPEKGYEETHELS